MIGGDFNIILHSRERSGGHTNHGEIEEFREWVDKLDLVDIPLMGSRWTWSNTRNNLAWSRIDQFLISNISLMQLAGFNQNVLHRPISDHFLLCIVPDGIFWGLGPFRLDNKWIKVEEFRNLVEKV